MSGQTHLQKAESTGFQSGRKYGQAKGCEEGYDQAFEVFLRMLEVEKERTVNVDKRLAITKIMDDTKVLKSIICL